MAHPTRMPLFDYHGRSRVFITARTDCKQPLFDDPVVAEFVVQQLLRITREGDIEATAYCVLPDHVHALAHRLLENCTRPIRCRALEQRTGYWRRNQAPATPGSNRRKAPRLWQGHYFDKVIRNGSEALTVVRYIATDPVRSGLVDSLEDYRWFGSHCWSRADLIEIASSPEVPIWWPDNTDQV